MDLKTLAERQISMRAVNCSQLCTFSMGRSSVTLYSWRPQTGSLSPGLVVTNSCACRHTAMSLFCSSCVFVYKMLLLLRILAIQ